MWCDDFDADLFKVLPDAREIIAPAADRRLYTHGGETDGKLNHPTCWHTPLGSTCFVVTDPAFLTPMVGAEAVYFTTQPVVACTWEELARDLWCHNLVAVLDGNLWWDAAALAPHMMTLMYELRGWTQHPPEVIDEAVSASLNSLRLATAALTGKPVHFAEQPRAAAVGDEECAHGTEREFCAACDDVCEHGEPSHAYCEECEGVPI